MTREQMTDEAVRRSMSRQTMKMVLGRDPQMERYLYRSMFGPDRYRVLVAEFRRLAAAA